MKSHHHKWRPQTAGASSCVFFVFFCFEGPADLDKQSKKVDTALQIPSMPNKHGGGYKSNSASESSTTAKLMQVHRPPLQLQKGCGGRPANAVQKHNKNWKQVPPVRQDDLPIWSRPGLVLKAPLLSAMQEGTRVPATQLPVTPSDFA